MNDKSLAGSYIIDAELKPEPLVFTEWDWEYYLWNNNLVEIGELE